MSKVKPPQKQEASKSPTPANWGTKAIQAFVGVAFLSLLIPQVQQYLAGVSHSVYDASTVTLHQGKYVGKILSSDNHPAPIEAWLGVPYAKPPVGELRFARPVPVSQSSETFQATEYGYRCPGKQLLKIDGVPDLEQSEDCLTLNVFKQKGQGSGKKVPVMVYMHGGAFNRGFAAMHDTASMVSWSSEPFVAISFNYRISALGFLNSELTAQAGLLNLGLHDQVLLLEWVQQNVEEFGGDPNDVTLVGLSAGAHSIGHHILNVKERRRLFHKAVIESGGPTSRALHPPESVLHGIQFHQFAGQVGCANVGAESEILPCLRAVPSETIIAAQLKVFEQFNPSVRWAWQPVIDGEIIPRRPLDAWKSDNWHKVKILTGFNHNEATMYVPKAMKSSEEFADFFATLLPQLSAQDLEKLEDLYPDPAKDASSPYVDDRDLSTLKIGPQFKRVEAAYGHYAYACPVRQTAHWAGKDTNPPVYLYHWALNRTVLGGANHGDQMWYETMNPGMRGVSETHDEIGREFNSYVTSFIVSGDPNAVTGRAPGRPKWRSFESARETMVFGAGNDEAAGGVGVGKSAELVRDSWAQEQCKFWFKQSENPED